ncbi:hypothetical protein OG909_16790 [Streptomyces sp. NBC_01754]|uniref:hypothetical protein n=1 Tax=Streptomyces sp. NBC_01754 TaxID=2975930 RepID=UPI002DD815D8|nr:hypothetical protein [Streptomyces sp. NBC_01754]WSC93799.1 hypothetical protein OG909_16790 [Streptomyces sp. NBC_01754]
MHHARDPLVHPESPVTLLVKLPAVSVHAIYIDVPELTGSCLTPAWVARSTGAVPAAQAERPVVAFRCW